MAQIISPLKRQNYIAQLKFYSTSENLIDPTTGQDRSLSVKVRVADDEGLLSSSVEKVVSLIDINDAPEFTWTAVDQVASITENGAGLTVATLGDLLDPEGDLISELTVEISQVIQLPSIAQMLQMQSSDA